MDASLTLRVIAVFFTFFASILGVCFPIFFDKIYGDRLDAELSERDWMHIMRAFAAGVMLGVAFIHLLFDGNEKLTVLCTVFPPIAFMLATVGTVIVLSFEQIAVQYISGHSSDEDHGDEDYNREVPGSVQQDNVHEHSGLSAIPISNTKNGTSKLTTVSNGVTYQHIRPGGGCEHNHAIRMIAEADSSSALLKAYMLEISVAVHSIIIGISIGTLSDPEDLKALESLIFAICLHQFIEGLGLGTVIKSTSMTLGPSKVVLFILTFGLSVSIGVVIGIVLSFIEQGHKSVFLDATTGVLNSLAAGILIYVALVEMVAEDFQSTQLAKRPELKKVMISALIAGNVSMGVLAFWA